MAAKGPRTTDGFRFMVMLTRDRGFGFVGMKAEVAFGLIRAKIQASGRDKPGGMDWVRRHYQGVPPGKGVPSFEPALGPSPTGPQTSEEAAEASVSGGSEAEELSYVTPDGMSTGRFCSKSL
jgi:hypothetical protein